LSRAEGSIFNHENIKIYPKRTKLHEVKHILRNDFDKDSCDQVEKEVR